jgi:hypothetical protein
MSCLKVVSLLFRYDPLRPFWRAESHASEYDLGDFQARATKSLVSHRLLGDFRQTRLRSVRLNDGYSIVGSLIW